jgi:MFS transporter, DHA1 family, multidrug resistance protein
MFYSLRQRLLLAESRGARATMCFMVIMLTALGIFMSDLYTPSLPAISHYFHVQPSLVKMSLAVYLLGLTFPQLLFGPLSDAIGRKKVIFPGLLIALVGSVCCMQAPNIYALNAGRFLQGIGIGALTASARAILRDVFSKQQMARVVAIMGFSIAVAPAVAPLIGAILAHHFGWRSVFVAMTVIIVSCVLLVYLLLPESNKNIDPSSFRLRLILINYKRLLQTRLFVCNMLLSACAFSIIMVYFTISPYLFEHQLNVTVSHYAWIGSSLVMIMMITRFINIQAIKTVPVAILVRYGYQIVLAGSVLLLILNVSMTMQVWTVMLPTAIILSGVSFIFGNVMTLALNECGKNAGTGGALYSSVQVLIASLFSFIASRVPSDTALPMGFLFVVLALLGLAIIRSNKR